MSLTELLIVLCLAGILLLLAVPGMRKGMDTVRVRAARETAYGLAIRTRSVALERGGAEIVFDVDKRTAEVIADGAVVSSVSFAEYDVAIRSDRVPRIVMQYDSRGIGRMASRTIGFVRGDAQAGVTFSSYGRVRRW